MTQADGSNYTNEARRDTFDPVSFMPEMPTSDIVGIVQVVALDGESDLGIGYKYRTARKGGATFVVFRDGWFGKKIISGCHPATEEGWRAVWREFVAINPKAAGTVQEVLYRMAETRRKKTARKERHRALEQKTLALVAGAVFLGGYTPCADLTKNSSYDLRFLEDNLGIFSLYGTKARGELPYSSFSIVQIGGPGLVTSVSPLVAPAEKVAGAAIRFAQPNSNENLLAAESSAVSAVLKAAGTRSKIQTVLFIQTVDSELFFLSAETEPDQLRINLSRGLGRIREVLGSTAVDQQAKQNKDFSSAISELDKAVALLDRGLLTREEFQQLKSRLIADS